MPTSHSVSHAEYLLEGLPELRVEDGVDERVDAAVEVAQPRGQVEGDIAGHPTEEQGGEDNSTKAEVGQNRRARCCRSLC